MQRKSLALAALLCVGSLAASAQVATRDDSTLSKAAETAVTTGKQLSQLEQIFSTVQTGNAILGTTGNYVVNPAYFGYANMASGFMPRITDQSAYRKPAFGSYPDSSTFQTPSSGRTWAQNNFYANNTNASGNAAATLTDINGSRQSAARNAAIDGYSLAQHIRTLGASTSTQADGLRSAASSSSDMRGDISANTAVILATYEHNMLQLQALASMLEIMSSKQIADDPQITR